MTLTGNCLLLELNHLKGEVASVDVCSGGSTAFDNETPSETLGAALLGIPSAQDQSVHCIEPVVGFMPSGGVTVPFSRPSPSSSTDILAQAVKLAKLSSPDPNSTTTLHFSVTVDEYLMGSGEDELNALQRHRKRKMLDKMSLEENLESINSHIKRIEQEIQVLIGNLKLLHEIDDTELVENTDHPIKIDNEIQLSKIFEKKTKVQEGRPTGNDKDCQKHQREKRKHLLKLQNEEFSEKKLKVRYLEQEKDNLNEIVDKKKLKLREIFQMKKIKA